MKEDRALTQIQRQEYPDVMYRCDIDPDPNPEAEAWPTIWGHKDLRGGPACRTVLWGVVEETMS